MLKNFIILILILLPNYFYGQGSGYSLTFNGNNTGINVGNTVANNCRTIEVWFKPDQNITSSFNHIETLTGRDYDNGNTSVDEFFLGEIDEVRFWTTERTQTEIREKMCSKLIGNEPGLKGYYRFDSGTGNTLLDNSTNSYNGTLVNMTNSNWVYSGAPIGDTSTYVYNNTSLATQTLSLNTNPGDAFTVNNINSSSKGVHIYKVNSLPNSLTNLTSPTTNNYYGVFLTDISGTFDINYDFSYYSCSSCTDLFSRNDNSVMSWTALSGTVNNCSISLSNESTVGYDYRAEYIVNIVGTNLNVNLGNDTTLCQGQSLVLDATTPNANYLWQDNSTNPTLNVNQQGTYWVQVSDACGSVTDTIIISYAPNPTVDLGPDTFLCPNSNYILDAGNSGASYLWNNNNTNQTITPTSSGMYNVTVTTNNSCSNTDSVYIEVSSLNINANITNVSCIGDSDGVININISNGSPPYSITCNGLQTTNNLDSLSIGNYNIVVTDSVGCQISQTYTVSEPPPISISANIQNLLCYGDNSGEINISVSGGNGGFSYQWSNNQTSQNINSLSPGSYIVTVTDNKNCTEIDSFTVTQPSQLNSSIIANNLLCYNDSNGSADLTVNGGTAPYSYLWSNGQTSQNATDLTGQTYTVTITDANNCQITNSVTITGINTPLSATISATSLLCYGDMDATAQITASGGTAPYSYLWSTGNNNNYASDLSAGDYFITVTDSNNCQIVETITVEQPSQIITNLPNDFFICPETQEVIQASTTGGHPGYTYQWNTGSTNSSITVSPNDTTTYVVTVTDANNCSTTSSVTVYTYPELNLNVFADNDTVCPGDMVLLSAIYSGGNGPPYNLYINGVQTTTPIAVFPSNGETFTITVKDQCNNSINNLYTLYNYPNPEVNFISNINSGCEPLTVSFSPTNECIGCTYNWDFGNDNISNSQNPVNTYNNAGVYNVSCTITNKYGCKNSLTINNMIYVYDNPNANFIADPEISNILDPIINFYNYSEGANQYYWNFGDGDTSNETNPIHNYNNLGEFNVELISTSVYGCSDTAYFTVIINTEFTFYAPSAFSPDGDGVNDYFRVFGTGIDNNNFKLLIFDRWGEIIFESDDINKAWNGKAKNGKNIVPNGTYVWKCYFKNLKGASFYKNGNLTVIR